MLVQMLYVYLPPMQLHSILNQGEAIINKIAFVCLSYSKIWLLLCFDVCKICLPLGWYKESEKYIHRILAISLKAIYSFLLKVCIATHNYTKHMYTVYINCILHFNYFFCLFYNCKSFLQKIISKDSF